MIATYRVWVVGWVDSLTVKQEAHAGWGLALTLTEGVHELLQLGRALDLEEDLVVVVRHLDVKVLRLRLVFGLVGGRSSIRHCEMAVR